MCEGQLTSTHYIVSAVTSKVWHCFWPSFLFFRTVTVIIYTDKKLLMSMFVPLVRHMYSDNSQKKKRPFQ